MTSASRSASRSTPRERADARGSPNAEEITVVPEGGPTLAWALNHPTGGSINNSVHIQLDIAPADPPSSRFASSASLSQPHASTSGASRKRSASSTSFTATNPRSGSRWRRDDPIGRTYEEDLLEIEGAVPLGVDYATTSFRDLSSAVHDASLLSAARESLEVPQEQERTQWWTSRAESCGRGRVSPAPQSQEGSGSSRTPLAPMPVAGSVRIMVNNNDQSINSYRLRPPTAGLTPSSRIEPNFAVLSRLHTLHFPTAINHSSFSPDRRTLVAVGDTPDVFIYHFDEQGSSHRIARYEVSDSSFSTSWHPDGTKFAVASQDGTVSVWDVRSSQPVAVLGTSAERSERACNAVRSVKFSPNGEMLAFTEHEKYFHIYDTNSFAQHQRIQIPQPPPKSQSPAGQSEQPTSSSSALGRSRPRGSNREQGSQGGRSGAGAPTSYWLNQATSWRSDFTRHVDEGRDQRSVWTPSPEHNNQRSPSSAPMAVRQDLAEGVDAQGDDRWGIADSPRRSGELSRRPFDAPNPYTDSTTSPSRGIRPNPYAEPATSPPRSIRPWAPALGNTAPPAALSRVLGDPSWDGQEDPNTSSARNTFNGNLITRTSHWSAVVNQMVQEEMRVENTLARGRRLPLHPPWPRLSRAREMVSRDLASCDFRGHLLKWSLGQWDTDDIAGICWDPDSEYLYVATTHNIARYEVLDRRVSFSGGGLL